MQKMFLYLFLAAVTSLACPLPASAHVMAMKMTRAEWGRKVSKQEIRASLKQLKARRKQARRAETKPKDEFEWIIVLLFASGALIGGAIGILTWLVLGGLWWLWLLGGMIAGMAILILMVDRGIL